MLSKNGFTLVELLVVITIIALLSIFAFVNFKDFAQDQVIKKAIGEIQTVLRLAQANATSSLLCQGLASVDWSVQIRADKVNVDLICGPSNFVVQTTPLQNVSVDSIKGSACTSSTSLPLTITYSKLSGAVKIDGVDDCIDDSSTIEVRVINTKEGYTDRFIPFTISSGGAINVE